MIAQDFLILYVDSQESTQDSQGTLVVKKA